MEAKKTRSGAVLFSVLFILVIASSVYAGSTTTINATDPGKSIEKRVNEVVCTMFNLVVLVAGGIASLMIILSGVKYMSAGDDPAQADDAKKMIGYALTGLVVVAIACPLVDYLVSNTKIVPFEKSCQCFFYSDGGGDGTTTTTLGTTTTSSGGSTSSSGGGTTSSTTTTSTTSTIPPERLLTAENLASCINSKGIFYTDRNCYYCLLQKNLFYAEVGAGVGDGKNVYDNVLTIGANSSNSPCSGGGGVPCWSYPAKSKSETGCKTFPQLREIYECDLVEVPGHSYKTCS